MNEPLRRALLRARLREDDVASRLGVDPKTVRRWLNGRVLQSDSILLRNFKGADAYLAKPYKEIDELRDTRIRRE